MERVPRRPAVDDPTGGRRLTRRLMVVLPIAAAIGAVIGLPFAIALSDWRPVLGMAALAAALAGTIAAAIEDGRVQRRVEGARTRDPGLARARRAAIRDDQETVREEVERALARGLPPEEVAEGIDDPSWPPERVAGLRRQVEAAR